MTMVDLSAEVAIIQPNNPVTYWLLQMLINHFLAPTNLLDFMTGVIMKCLGDEFVMLNLMRVYRYNLLFH